MSGEKPKSGEHSVRKPLTAKEVKLLRKTADEFIARIEEIVDHCLILEDVDKLGRLVTQVLIFMDSEVLDALRDKGFSDEITELCDKAGKIK
jgi:hypothetical protein